MCSDNIKKSNLGHLLLNFRRNLLEKIKSEGIKSDLTFSQVEIIQFIGISGEKTMKSIADYLKIKPPSVTEIIKEMENKKMIKRTSDKTDRRIVTVALTNAAKNNFISISKHKEAILDKMTSKLSKNDQITLERLIKIILENK